MRSLGSRADEDVRSVVWARVWPLLLLELSEPALLVLPMLVARCFLLRRPLDTPLRPLDTLCAAGRLSPCR